MAEKRVVLAEFFTAEDRTLLFLIRKDFDEPLVKEISISGQAIRDFVRQFFQGPKPPNQTPEPKIIKPSPEAIQNFPLEDFQTFLQPLIAPLADLSPNQDKVSQPEDIVWLVPHDFLHYIPLHAIELEGQPLIERNAVCYTPSASVMKYCQAKRKGKRNNILIFADSEENRFHTQQQANLIASCFQKAPYTADVYVGNEATKDTLTRKLETQKDTIDILHLACHGNFQATDALQSSIIFADHKQLTAEDIFGLTMNADLVTLSACESGINENKPGDELIGLTRALIYAGTPSVVVSLWKVEQIATSILMTQFYQNLQAGQDKADALRHAQCELQKMTAQMVIDYCKTAQAQQTDSNIQQILEIDIANMQCSANDFEQAEMTYTKVYQWFKPDSEYHDKTYYDRARRGRNRCKSKKRVFANKPVNYAIPVYQSLFYWAPFILVGDWK